MFTIMYSSQCCFFWHIPKILLKPCLLVSNQTLFVWHFSKTLKKMRPNPSNPSNPHTYSQREKYTSIQNHTDNQAHRTPHTNCPALDIKHGRSLPRGSITQEQVTIHKSTERPHRDHPDSGRQVIWHQGAELTMHPSWSFFLMRPHPHWFTGDNSESSCLEPLLNEIKCYKNDLYTRTWPKIQTGSRNPKVKSLFTIFTTVQSARVKQNPTRRNALHRGARRPQKERKNTKVS